MDLARAQQILNSEKEYRVLLNGSPVWIENLQPAEGTAVVKPLENAGETVKVPVAELREG